MKKTTDRLFALSLAALITTGACGHHETEYAVARVDPNAPTRTDAGLVGSDALPATPVSGSDASAGGSCLDDSECGSGYCVARVCCDEPCQGNCESCTLPGSVGTCSPIAAGLDPKGGCDTDELCGGTCDGKGACQFPGTELTCGGTFCTNGELTHERCDGQGACVMSKESCGGLACANTKSCKTTCTSDSDCLGNDVLCLSGACVPAQPGGKN